jgi:hypothetical protein
MLILLKPNKEPMNQSIIENIKLNKLSFMKGSFNNPDGEDSEVAEFVVHNLENYVVENFSYLNPTQLSNEYQNIINDYNTSCLASSGSNTYSIVVHDKRINFHNIPS